MLNISNLCLLPDKKTADKRAEAHLCCSRPLLLILYFYHRHGQGFHEPFGPLTGLVSFILHLVFLRKSDPEFHSIVYAAHKVPTILLQDVPYDPPLQDDVFPSVPE